MAAQSCITIDVTIHNGSAELIGPVKIQVLDGYGKVFEDAAWILGSVEPETDEVAGFCLSSENFPGGHPSGSTIVYRDARAAWWRRHGAEPIEAVHDDPANREWPQAMRDEWAENARRWGGKPSPDSPVPWRAHGHRFTRRLRGKSPIP